MPHTASTGNSELHWCITISNIRYRKETMFLSNAKEPAMSSIFIYSLCFDMTDLSLLNVAPYLIPLLNNTHNVNILFSSMLSSWFLTRLCWFWFLSVNRTKVFSQATRRSPLTEQHATATGRSDSGISMSSICTPPRIDAPRRRWPNKRTPTLAFSSAWVEHKKLLL